MNLCIILSKIVSFPYLFYFVSALSLNKRLTTYPHFWIFYSVVVISTIINSQSFAFRWQNVLQQFAVMSIPCFASQTQICGDTLQPWCLGWWKRIFSLLKIFIWCFRRDLKLGRRIIFSLWLKPSREFYFELRAWACASLYTGQLLTKPMYL